MNSIKNQVLCIISFALFLCCAVPANASTITTVLGVVASKTGIGGSIMTMINLFGLGDYGYCWFCGIYETLFNAMNTLTTKVAQELSSMFLGTLGLGILFYVAFKVLALMVKTQEVSLAQFLEDMIKRLGRALIAAAFIASALPFFYYVLSPFLEYTFNLSNVLLEEGAASGGAMIEASESLLSLVSENFCSNDTVWQVSNDSSIKYAFGDGVLNGMLCMLETVSASLVLGMVIGAVIMLLGIADSTFGILPNFSLLLTGVVFFGTYFMIYLSVPFKLIDALIRLSFVCALTPLWIILWVFPVTAGYTRNAWEMFLNCCVTFICMSVMLVLVFQLLDASLPNIETVIKYMLLSQDAAAAKELSLLSPSSLLTAAIGMLAKQMISASSIIAQNIVKSYDAGIGGQAESKIMASMQALGTTAGGAVAGGALGLAGSAAGLAAAAEGGTATATKAAQQYDNMFKNAFSEPKVTAPTQYDEPK